MNKLNIYEKLNIKTKITLYKKDERIGKGLLDLLTSIKEEGSINKACKKMDMSYTKALKILKMAEKATGIKFIDAKIGGANGGETKLTNEAKNLIKNFEKLNKRVGEFAKKEYKALFKGM